MLATLRMLRADAMPLTTGVDLRTGELQHGYLRWLVPIDRPRRPTRLGGPVRPVPHERGQQGVADPGRLASLAARA
jgi:hypothetical protein